MSSSSKPVCAQCTTDHSAAPVNCPFLQKKAQEYGATICGPDGPPPRNRQTTSQITGKSEVPNLPQSDLIGTKESVRMAAKIKPVVETLLNGAQQVVEIDCPDLTWEMKPVPKCESDFICIDKVRETCTPIDPTKIDWGKVSYNSWFMCIKPGEQGLFYQFPIMESENRDNLFMRPKYGIKKFAAMGFNVYKIGR